MKIVFPSNLYPWQRDILEDINNHYNVDYLLVVKAFRQRCGKSSSISLILIKASLELGGTSIYIAPTIQQSRSQFADIIKMLDGSGVIKSNNASTLEIVFTNGANILFRSAAQDDSLRGLTAEAVLVFDEVAFMDKEFIMKALPLRAVHKALTILVSTPLTMNGFFWEAFNNPNNKIYDWSKYLNDVYTKEELESLKLMYPPNIYQTEILGEFISAGGLLFQNINECIKESTNVNKLYIGVDLSSAVGGDYTAITVLNEDREVVDVVYNNKLEPAARIEWISNYINKLPNVQKVLIETNNCGLTYISMLKKELRYPITNWNTSEASKKDIIQALQMAFENKTISIINNPELLKELQSFGAIVNPKTGKIKYEGINCKDDLVMSLAIALKALESNYGNYKIKIK